LSYFFKVLISLISYSMVSYKQSTFVIRYLFKRSYTAHIYLIANFLGVCNNFCCNICFITTEFITTESESRSER